MKVSIAQQPTGVWGQPLKRAKHPEDDIPQMPVIEKFSLSPEEARAQALIFYSNNTVGQLTDLTPDEIAEMEYLLGKHD